MKKNKKIIIFAIIAVMSIFLLTITNAYGNDIMSLLGRLYREQVKSISNEEDVICTVGGQKITSETIRRAKMMYEAAGVEKSEEEIFYKIAGDLLLVEEAKKLNITVSDKEVEEQINNIKARYKENTEAYDKLKRYLSSAGLTETKYWELAKPIYRRLLILGKFKYQYLKPKFLKENKNLKPEEIETRFEEYYRNYRDELIKKSNIRYRK